MVKIKTINKLFTRANSLAMAELYYKGIWESTSKIVGFRFTSFALYNHRGTMEVYRNFKEQSVDLTNHTIKKIKKDKNFFKKLKQEYLSDYQAIKKINSEIDQLDFNNNALILSKLNELEKHFLVSDAAVVIIYWLQKRGDTDAKFKEDYPLISEEAYKLREHTEDFYALCTQFFNAVLTNISKKKEINIKYIDCMRLKEVKSYLRRGHLPDIGLLKKRSRGFLIFNNSFYLMEDRSLDDFLSARNYQIEHEKNENSDLVSGQTGFPGKVIGKIQILRHFRDCDKFKKGNILVGTMTNQLFLPALKRAGAIVTDEGGTLCHAAIIAREFKIPCVIGTKVATTAFQDDDKVEVDAEKGIVKKI